MSNCIEPTVDVAAEERSAWPAVVSLALGVFGLVTAELLPASLLTPMARGLAISEALAGQAVSATAIVALFAALLSGVATRGLDRRHVLVGFSVLLVVSNLLVATAPNFALLMLARALLGIALGGFWSMATATAIRLVPPAKVPRALSVMFSGLSLAAIVAIPLGSYLGGIYGWRNVFTLAAGLGVATAIFQMLTLPRLPPEKSASVTRLLGLFGLPGVSLGILAIVLVFGGHFGLFTYVRPFLESTSQAGFDGIAATLMWFGIANFVGTLLAGAMLARSVRLTLTFMPFVIAAAVLGLVWLHGGSMVQGVLVALWGLAYGAVPVAWSTWMAQAVPEDTEAGGGLMVAAVQFAITMGVAGGGLIYSQAGAVGVFLAGGALMLLTSGLIAWKVVVGRTP
jgi:predicted MFS family arabinose efflux permease